MSNLTAPVTSPESAAPAASTRTPARAAGSLLTRCGNIVDALADAAARVAAIVADIVRASCTAVARAAARAGAYLVELTGWSASTVAAFAFVLVVLVLLALGYAGRSWLA